MFAFAVRSKEAAVQADVARAVLMTCGGVCMFEQTYEGHIAAVPMPIEARSSSRCQTMLKSNGFVDSLQKIVILALAEVAACFFV